MPIFKIGNLSDDYYFQWHWREAKNARAVVDWWCEKEWVHDSDTCGDRKSYLAVGLDGVFEYYLVEHQWSWDNYGQENSNLENVFEVTELSEEEARKRVRKWQVV